CRWHEARREVSPRALRVPPRGRRRPRRTLGRGAAAMTRVAAVDMGTNSTRLLIADVDGRGRDAKLVTIDRRTRITRPGQGVDRDRTLRADAIERTLPVLREYRGAMNELGVQRVRATATSAARDASNRDALFDPTEELLGVRPELLSGDEEARLEFLGAT